MVKINRVYTRTGDDGRTVLGDGARLPRFHIRVAACGSVDEANSFIGLACLHVGEEVRSILLRIQNDLFDIGADLCRPERSGLKLEPLRVTEDQVRWLEEVLDAQNSKLEPLSSFVLPGGTQGAALLHIVRTVVRRAEREIVGDCVPGAGHASRHPLHKSPLGPALRPRSGRERSGRDGFPMAAG
jgi:cob(I)alamin adenosyltransferase